MIMNEYKTISKYNKKFKWVLNRDYIKGKDDWLAFNAEMAGFKVYELDEEFVFDRPLQDLSIHIAKDGKSSSQKGGDVLDLSLHNSLHTMINAYLSEETLKDIIEFEDKNNISIGVIHTYKD